MTWRPLLVVALAAGQAPADNFNPGPPDAAQRKQMGAGREEDRGIAKPWMGDKDGAGRANFLATVQKMSTDYEASKNQKKVARKAIRAYLKSKNTFVKQVTEKGQNDLRDYARRNQDAYAIVQNKMKAKLIGSLENLELDMTTRNDVLKKMAPLKGVRAPSRRFIGQLPRVYNDIVRKAMKLYTLPEKFHQLLSRMEDVATLQRKYVEAIGTRQNMFTSAVNGEAAALKKTDNSLATQMKSYSVQVKEKYKPLLKFVAKFNAKMLPKAVQKINRTTSKSVARANYLGDKSDMRLLAAARKLMSAYDRDREGVSKVVDKSVKKNKRQLIKTMRTLDKAITASMKGMAAVIDLATRKQNEQIDKPRLQESAISRRVTELEAHLKEQKYVIRDWMKEFLTDLEVQAEEIQAVEDQAVADAMRPAKSQRGSSLYYRKYNAKAARLKQLRDKSMGKLESFKEEEVADVEKFAQTLDDANETANEQLEMLKEYEQEEMDSVPDPAVVQSREQVNINRARALRSASTDKMNDRLANITQAMDLELAATAQDTEAYLPKVLDTIDGLQQLTVQPQEAVSNFILNTDLHIRNSLPPVFAKRKAFNDRARTVEREDRKSAPCLNT
jgi:hypothetical protein